MKTFTSPTAAAAFTALAAAQSSSTTASASSAAAAPTEVTEVTDCHFHGGIPYCFAGEDEWEVDDYDHDDELPDAYTNCHSHGEDEL